MSKVAPATSYRSAKAKGELRSLRGSVIPRSSKSKSANINAINTLHGVSQDIVDSLLKSKQTIHGLYGLGQYVRSRMKPENPILRQCREQAVASGALEAMQISIDEGAALALVARMVNARKCIDIGFFTGYSALVVALALPEDGKITGIDINDEWAAKGEEYFRKAGVEHKLDLRIQDAVEVLDDMLKNGEEGMYDFVFIDADKGNYTNYYERSLKLLRPGGVIAGKINYRCNTQTLGHNAFNALSVLRTQHSGS
jgi:predicted O-methyltransferase YrrM